MTGNQQQQVIVYKLVSSDNPIEFSPELGVFKCVVLLERPVGEDFRRDVSRALVRNGCLYFMAWGRDCSLWHHSVDTANGEQFDFGDIPDDKFVMTTCHEDEPMEEVLWFAKFLAQFSYADEPLPKLLVLDFATHDRSELVNRLVEQAD